jgi:hypothetical protein
MSFLIIPTNQGFLHGRRGQGAICFWGKKKPEPQTPYTSLTLPSVKPKIVP